MEFALTDFKILGDPLIPFFFLMSPFWNIKCLFYVCPTMYFGNIYLVLFNRFTDEDKFFFRMNYIYNLTHT